MLAGEYSARLNASGILRDFSRAKLCQAGGRGFARVMRTVMARHRNTVANIGGGSYDQRFRGLRFSHGNFTRRFRGRDIFAGDGVYALCPLSSHRAVFLADEILAHPDSLSFDFEVKYRRESQRGPREISMSMNKRVLESTPRIFPEDFNDEQIDTVCP